MSSPQDSRGMSASLDLATRLFESLRIDLGNSSAVGGLMIMDLTLKAAELRRDIQALNEAMIADTNRASWTDVIAPRSAPTTHTIACVEAACSSR